MKGSNFLVPSITCFRFWHFLGNIVLWIQLGYTVFAQGCEHCQIRILYLNNSITNKLKQIVLHSNRKVI